MSGKRNLNNDLVEKDRVDYPIQFYLEKKSNELMAHAYSSLYKIPETGLRFFTVYVDHMPDQKCLYLNLLRIF